jgi:hypothetical protein
MHCISVRDSVHGAEMQQSLCTVGAEAAGHVAVVAGVAGGSLRVFDRGPQQGIALLCQARWLNGQH